MKNKTLREWYQELPEPYRSKAIRAATEQGVLDTVRDSSAEAVNCFAWFRTQEDENKEKIEGEDYWQYVYDCLAEGRELPGVKSTTYEIY